MDEIKDRRRNSIGDRIKHICHHIDNIERRINVIKIEQISVDKDFELLKGDLRHLCNDIYGINNNENSCKTNRTETTD